MPPSIIRFILTQTRCSTSNLHISFTTSRWRVAVKPVSCLLFWLLSPLSPLRLSPLIIKFTFPVFFQDSREAVIWLAVHHKQKKALELFSREVAPAGTGMGTTNTIISSLNSKLVHSMQRPLRWDLRTSGCGSSCLYKCLFMVIRRRTELSIQ